MHKLDTLLLLLQCVRHLIDNVALWRTIEPEDHVELRRDKFTILEQQRFCKMCFTRASVARQLPREGMCETELLFVIRLFHGERTRKK